jgi:hypothetical protein
MAVLPSKQNHDKYMISGHEISRRYFLNLSRPRVCPLCLYELGYCHISWEIALATACPIHRCILVDHCGTCERPLTWNRPSLNQCKCMFPIDNDQERPSTASPIEVEMSNWIALQFPCASEYSNRLACTINDLAKSTHSLIRMIAPLDLDAGLSFVFAMHTLCSRQQVSREIFRSDLNVERKILTNAELAVQTIEAPEEIPAFLGYGSVAHLLAQFSKSELPAERDLAYSLLNRIFSGGSKSSWSSVYPSLAQRSLF